MLKPFHGYCTLINMFTKTKTLIVILTGFLIKSQSVVSQQITTPAPKVLEWKVEGTSRSALVYIPEGSKSKKTPIIFAFHGHGGSQEHMYRTRRFDQLWPEAIFICPQGLNTPGLLTDPEGKSSGWQNQSDILNDRDLKFFDTMLAYFIAQYQVDQDRVFVTGHSNGGGFTYLLWAERGKLFAGLAPTATVAGRNRNKLIPKPVLHLYGEKDQLVPAERQKNTCEFLLKLNGCTDQETRITENATSFSSKTGNPVIIYKSPGGHSYPQSANQLIIDFFKKTKKGD